MEIIKLNGNKVHENTVCAIGFFDGVHLAHRKLIDKTVQIGNDLGLKKGIITFDVHPKSILFDLDYHYLTPLDRKIELFQEFDVDYIYVIVFDKEKAQMNPNDFIDFYLNIFVPVRELF